MWPVNKNKHWSGFKQAINLSDEAYFLPTHMYLHKDFSTFGRVQYITEAIKSLTLLTGGQMFYHLLISYCINISIWWRFDIAAEKKKKSMSSWEKIC